MKLFTTANLNWLDDGCCDVKYLDVWNETPRSYQPGQPIDDSWHVDSYELSLGLDENGRLFKKAADRLMRYQFYPHDVMSHTSDFALWNRWAQVGDRIVQRIHLLNLFGKPILDVVTMTEISQVITEPRCYGFTYVTVDTHVEQGEWSAWIEWQDNNELSLTVKAISRPRAEEPARNHSYMRRLQQTAHQRGLAHFKQTILS
ncbi:MAG: DUF1990 family protein [Anaerolineales bacterium]|nr:DUF1990 family protein [Anaerolineales bacterium]